MTKIMNPLSLLFAVTIAGGLGLGCIENEKGPLPDPTTGKADGSLTVEEHGELGWGDSAAVALTGTNAHAWTVTVTSAATARFATTGATEVDTVVYVHSGEVELALDDDGGEGRFSNLEVELLPGTYRVTVMGYSPESRGEVTVTAACTGADCADEPTDDPTADPWALARDVELHHVAFTDATPIPERWVRPEGTAPVSLSSPEWWQRWSGGATQSFSWDQGTDYGKRCGVASGIRLQAIMDHRDGDRQPGREAFQRLLDGSGWSGTMYNWTEDVSQGGYPVFQPATIWAWRTSAIKWINVVNADGSCDLPTLALVESYVDKCLAQAAANNGEIQGCRLSER